MDSIVFEEGINNWQVASFIFKRGGMFNEFDNYFSIWTEKRCFHFNNGDTISFLNNSFKIN